AATVMDTAVPASNPITEPITTEPVAARARLNAARVIPGRITKLLRYIPYDRREIGYQTRHRATLVSTDRSHSSQSVSPPYTMPSVVKAKIVLLYARSANATADTPIRIPIPSHDTPADFGALNRAG